MRFDPLHVIVCTRKEGVKEWTSGNTQSELGFALNS